MKAHILDNAENIFDSQRYDTRTILVSLKISLLKCKSETQLQRSHKFIKVHHEKDSRERMNWKGKQ